MAGFYCFLHWLPVRSHRASGCCQPPASTASVTWSVLLNSVRTVVSHTDSAPIDVAQQSNQALHKASPKSRFFSYRSETIDFSLLFMCLETERLMISISTFCSTCITVTVSMLKNVLQTYKRTKKEMIIQEIKKPSNNKILLPKAFYSLLQGPKEAVSRSFLENQVQALIWC